MDIYSYINSRDVAEYCKSIGKTWTVFEMAVIIARSNRTIVQKHDAWRELMRNYPDMPTPKNMHHKSYDSLHKKLAEVIDYEERLVELFKTPEDGAVYTHKALWNNEYSYSNCVFPGLEETMSDARENWERDETPEFVITKIFVCNKNRIESYIDYDGNIYNVYVYGDMTNLFPGIILGELFDNLDQDFYIDIPAPFKRGDILVYRNQRNKNNSIFVLKELDRDDPKVFERIKIAEYGDGTDLIGWGYFVSDSGILYGDHTPCYDHLEYYRGKLEGNQRLLHYVNLYLTNDDKCNIDLPELLTMQCRIISEHQMNSDFCINTHGCFVSERDLAENRLTQEEKEKIKQTNGLMPWVADKLSIHQVEFLAKEKGCSVEKVQMVLSDGGGWFMGMCAGMVHEENHYSKTNDSRFNHSRRAMAKMILESYGKSESGWIDNFARQNTENQFPKGVEENNEEAVMWYRKAADQGNAAAQNSLGLLYYYGNGVEENNEEAVKWFRKAAEQGNAAAQWSLGNCYYNGHGVDENDEEAVKWYRKAAEQGDAEAQKRFGFLYYWGLGVERDYKEADKWFRKAAEQGNLVAQYHLGAKQGDAEAQWRLGKCYDYGDGIEEDKEEAVMWYRKAAKQGYADAQKSLGDCYRDGEGVELDYEEAVKWYRKAADQGNADAQRSLGRCYYYGHGVEQDQEKAARLGYEPADDDNDDDDD